MEKSEGCVALLITFDGSASRPQSLKRGDDLIFLLCCFLMRPYAAVRLFALVERSTDLPAVALIFSASSVSV
jgi:hypothetical protein